MKRGIRLDQLVARNLNLARRHASALLTSGRLIRAGVLPDPVDAPPFLDPRAPVGDTELPLSVILDGQPITLHDQYHLLLHKPTGCVTALHDGHHATVYTLVKDAPLARELRPVGRLDKDTSGLLLFTTDGQWLHRLIHPKNRVPRRYQAALARGFENPSSDLTLADGHRPDIVALKTIHATQCHPALARASEATTFAEITIIGGAYHEVRRIFAALGSHVLSLCRTHYGDHELPSDLAPGQWMPITPGA